MGESRHDHYVQLDTTFLKSFTEVEFTYYKVMILFLLRIYVYV